MQAAEFAPDRRGNEVVRSLRRSIVEATGPRLVGLYVHGIESALDWRREQRVRPVERPAAAREALRVFDSRETRDLANQGVAADPRMPDLIDSSGFGFDAERMAYGGFASLV